LFVVALGGALLVFLVACASVYFVLSQLPGRVQIGVGALLIIASLVLRIDRPGHFSPRYQPTQMRRMLRPEPPVPPFSVYVSPEKEKEIRQEGGRRMRLEWIGDRMEVTNLTAESLRLRIDFYGAYSPNSSINCRGGKEPALAELPVVPTQSTYMVERVVCGDGFKAFSIWAWNDAGDLIFHESTH
jgi:hypothetical protein